MKTSLKRWSPTVQSPAGEGRREKQDRCRREERGAPEEREESDFLEVSRGDCLHYICSRLASVTAELVSTPTKNNSANNFRISINMKPTVIKQTKIFLFKTLVNNDISQASDLI